MAPGDWLAVTIAAVGEIPARVVRAADRELGLVFHLPPSPARLVAEIAARAHDLSAWDADTLAELWEVSSGSGGGDAA
jgi:hypothetical protein